MKLSLTFTDAFSLAVHSLVLLAEPGKRLTAKEIAGRLDASEAHLHKVLASLRKAGLLRSTRGPDGGYALARSPQEINLAQVYLSIEGKPGGDSCLLGRKRCAGRSCIFSGLLEETTGRMWNFMESTTIASAAEPFLGQEQRKARDEERRGKNAADERAREEKRR